MMKSSKEERSPIGLATVLAILANLIVVVQFVGTCPTPITTPPSELTTTPPPEPAPDPPSIVYRTPSGERYHRATCFHVKGKAIRITLKEAKEMSLTPCKTCHPPPLP
jgi:hypothetical protein